MLSFRNLVLSSVTILAITSAGQRSLAADEKKGPLEGGAVQVLETVAGFDTKNPNYAMSYRVAMRDLRAKLEKAEAQDELLKKLPTLATRQLVVLWDGFWLHSQVDAAAVPLGKLRDLDDLAKGFAAKFNAATLAALAEEKDKTRQQLYVNMISQQSHTFTKEQAKEFERLRDKIQNAGK